MVETAKQFIARKNKQFESEKDKPVRMKDIGREGHHFWWKEAWVFMPQSNYAEKVFVIERFRRTEPQGKMTQKGKLEIESTESDILL